MKYSLVLKALTPISHGDTLTGINNNSNTRLFMRQEMLVNDISMRVPSISENSLRSTIWRKSLADHLIKTVEAKVLPKTVINLLYSGGNLMSGASAPAAQLTLGKIVHNKYPGLELLSGSVDNFLLPAGKFRPCAWIVAKEYLPILEHVAPQDICQDAKNVSVFDLVSEEIRTRGTGAESSDNQMIYSYEVLAAGVKIFMQIDIDNNASELCKSAAGFAINFWDGFIGGQASQGRGFMTKLDSDLPSGTLYESYVSENKAELLAGLENGDFCTGVKLCGGK